MIDLKNIQNIYFIGVGGIGMSAIARYFNTLGKNVAGYDKTSTTLTANLQNEGIKIHFDDDVNFINKQFLNKQNTLIVYTPAIPDNHKELNFFKQKEFSIYKRAEILGIISQNKKTIAVAGTHGKTSISTITAYLLDNSKIKCSAFLGGISKNFNSNLVISEKSDFVVAEADEFDRSFLHLSPEIAIISSIDADHLDIYGTKQELEKSFADFANQINTNGKLIIKKGLNLNIKSNIEIFTYSVNQKADFYAENIRTQNAVQYFDLQTPFAEIKNLMLGIPGIINIENSIAAIAAALLSGVDKNEIKTALPEFSGVKRRFDYIIKSENIVFIDDYAHHPEELKATISSVKQLYEDKKITGIFQPHLYSRTKDFYKDFAKSLDLLDNVILLDIYPAREKKIEGVSSELIFNEIKNRNKILTEKKDLLNVLKDAKIEVLLTLGAGDIDAEIGKIKELLESK